MYSSTDVAGNQPFNDWFTPDTVQRHKLGQLITAIDPFWGGGTFIYLTCATTLAKGNLCMWTEAYVAAVLPSTALQGFPFGVCMGGAMTTGMFGWFQLQGYAVLSSSADVAADAAAGIGTAGNVGANSAGKQLLNYRSRKANAATVALTNVQKQNGSAVIVTNGYDGWFLGMALSGTGVPGATKVAKLDPDGRTVYMGSAIGTVDKLSTTTDSVTVTGTFTGFVGAIINFPFAQGAIT